MERLVKILRARDNGTFVVNPMGTFTGYGGYVGINPYREHAGEASEELGELVLELLEQSGPTGFRIEEIEPYREDTTDPETDRVREAHIPKTSSTAAMAKRYARAQVSRKDRQKSWKITTYRYDSTRKLDVPDLMKSPDRLPLLASVGVANHVIRQVLAESAVSRCGADQAVPVPLQWLHVSGVKEDQPPRLDRSHLHRDRLVLDQQGSLHQERNPPARARALRSGRRRAPHGR